MMEKVFELPQGVRVTIELPAALPDAVAESVSIDVDMKTETEEQAREAIEAFGGLAAFGDVKTTAGAAHSWMGLLGAEKYHGDCAVTLMVPTGRERPVPAAPFLSELRDEQVKLKAAQDGASEATPAEAA